MLAFWCGGDTEQMDRLFRKSGLMRDKWERDDYRASTLERAVNSCTSFYKPVRVSSPADDFSDISGQLQSFDLLNNPATASAISASAGFLPICIKISAASFRSERNGTSLAANAGKRMSGA